MIKKRMGTLFMALALGLSLLAGCKAEAVGNGSSTLPVELVGVEEEAQRLSVVATIFPQYDFVRNIAGEHVELTMLLSPGSESHSYEPTPQDVITIQNCDLFIYVGGEGDAWVERILDSMDTSAMTIVALTELVETVEEEYVEGMEVDHGHDEEEDGHDEDDHDDDDHDDDDHEDDHEHELDEHVWTSPKNAITIVEALSATLCRLDADNAAVYSEAADSYVESLAELDAAFEEVRANSVRSTLVFGDRFPFRYLADAYDLEYFAAFPGCSTETEPSAATVAFLIDKVRDEEIPVVFHIEFSNEKMADTIAGETGAEKLILHSVHNVAPADIAAGVGYLDLMWQNVENLREALS